MKKALLVVHTKTFFPRMLEFGRLISKTQEYVPIFHFAYKTGWLDIENDVKLLEHGSFRISGDTRRFVAGMAQSKINISQYGICPMDAIIRFLKRCLSIDFFSSMYHGLLEIKRRLLIGNFFFFLMSIRRRMSEIQAVLREESADIVVLSADVPHWDTGAFIRVSRTQLLPTVVLFSQTGPLDEAGYVCSRKWSLRTALPWNYVLGKIYPKWVCQKNNKEFLMMGFGVTLAKELLHVSMPQPWIESSSQADAVLIENEAYLQRGVNVGLKTDNLFLTGQPFHDVLYSVLADKQANLSKLCDSHGLPSNKPIILTSLLPNYQGRDTAGAEFRSYKEMVEFWIRTLTGYTEYSTVVSLHPSQKYSDYSYIEQWGAKITRLPMPEIMPLCHVFVASLSSTITMAIACGKPVINYDYACYGNTHYDSAPGVLKVEKRVDFIKILRNVLCDTCYYEQLVLTQQSDAQRWGALDGKAGVGIIKVMRTLMKLDET